jgi:capsular exopolysaccharide synthesis family protein
MDADLHRPRVHSVFNAQFHPGLSGIFLQRQLHLNGELQPTSLESLFVLSAGKLPVNPSELLGSNRMREILGMLLERSDLVILDSPPVLSVTDAVVLAPVVDGVVIVVRLGQTRMSALRHSIEQLRYVGGNLVGVVINDLNEKDARYGYYYRSQYYKAYQHYGADKPKKGGKKSPETAEVPENIN